MKDEAKNDTSCRAMPRQSAQDKESSNTVAAEEDDGEFLRKITRKTDE